MATDTLSGISCRKGANHPHLMQQSDVALAGAFTQQPRDIVMNNRLAMGVLRR